MQVTSVNARLLEALRDVQLCGYHLDDEAMSKVNEAIADAGSHVATEPKRLTDEEIMQAVRHISFNEMTAFNIARAI